MPQSFLTNSNNFSSKGCEAIRDVFTRTLEIIEQEDVVSLKDQELMQETFKNLVKFIGKYDSTHKNLIGKPIQHE